MFPSSFLPLVVLGVVNAQAQVTLAQTAVSQSNWAQLAQDVNGQLLQGVPFAQPCFDEPTSAECSKIQASYTDQLVRSNVSGAYMNSQWETCQRTSEQCLLDWTQPTNARAMQTPYKCELGSISGHILNVTKASDVLTAFEFAKKNGVQISIKNTGHDYKGRSSAPNSLSLWTHNLKDISYNPEFIPAECPSADADMAVTVGAGVQFLQFYEFASQHNITVVGGTDRSVGAAGGWLQGGGHSQLSVVMGLGVDRVLEYTLVTPDGQLRVANRCQNQDLFWALRGGGGGTFGVVLSATIKASPIAKIQMVLVTYPADAADITQGLWGVMVDHSIEWAKAGWGLLASNGTAVYINPVLSPSDAAASMSPITDWAKSKTGVTVIVKEFPDYLSYYTFFVSVAKAVTGAPLSIASRLIREANFDGAAKKTELLNALISANSVPNARLIILGTAPYSYSPPSSANLGSEDLGGKYGTSVTSAWRDSLFHITVSSTWNFDATVEDKKAGYARVRQAVASLRAITPDAAYQNEADIYEPNHEVSFWGDNYAKLLEIKNKYDPDHLLDCWHCVGWQQNSPRYQCYLDSP